MIEHLYKTENWFEGTCNVSFLNCSMDVNVSKGIPVKYVENCIKMLDCLPNSIIDDLCKYSIRCFEDFQNAYEFDLDERLINHNIPKHVEGRKILEYISPVKISFKTIQNINVLAVDIYFDCKWENNYGMEWVIRDSKIVYVGFYQGVGAWVEDGYTFGNYVLNEHPFD